MCSADSVGGAPHGCDASTCSEGWGADIWGFFNDGDDPIVEMHPSGYPCGETVTVFFDARKNVLLSLLLQQFAVATA